MINKSDYTHIVDFHRICERQALEKKRSLACVMRDYYYYYYLYFYHYETPTNVE